MDYGRSLDLADRYVNNKATKYLLRADRIEDAERIISLFARFEGNAQYYLYEMQVCVIFATKWWLDPNQVHFLVLLVRT